MRKKLRETNQSKKAYLNLDKGAEIQPVEHTFKKKFPDQQDFSKFHDISLFQEGSLVGEHDVYKNGQHSTTVTCHSRHGVLWKMSRATFMRIQRNKEAWANLTEMVAFRQFRKMADDVEETYPFEHKQQKYQEFKDKHEEPWVWDLLLQPRAINKENKIQPYMSHPNYLKKLEE